MVLEESVFSGGRVSYLFFYYYFSIAGLVWRLCIIIHNLLHFRGSSGLQGENS